MLYLQKKITSPLKTGPFQKENFILQPLIFRSYVFVFTGITSRVSLRYMTPTQTMALFCLREIPSQKLPARFFASSLIFSKKKMGSISWPSWPLDPYRRKLLFSGYGYPRFFIPSLAIMLSPCHPHQAPGLTLGWNLSSKTMGLPACPSRKQQRNVCVVYKYIYIEREREVFFVRRYP